MSIIEKVGGTAAGPGGQPVQAGESGQPRQSRHGRGGRGQEESLLCIVVSKLLETLYRQPETITRADSKKKGLCYEEYQSFCPVVWIESPLTSSLASECVPPTDTMGGGDALAWGGGGGSGPIPTKGQTLWSLFIL